MQQPLLAVEHLSVTLRVGSHSVYALRDVSFELQRGKTLALVGESGCGKSMTANAIMRLLPDYADVAGSLRFSGELISAAGRSRMQALRGNRIALITQSPMSALNPTMCIGDQVAEPLRLHRRMPRRAAWQEAQRLLTRLEVPDAAARMRQFPHQFSGGMLQRVVAAMAVSCGPDLLIADEPTTALDVTVQAQLLSLLADLQREQGMGMILISHDLAVVAQVADEVAVMYAGEIVEQAEVHRLFASPAHPYTRGLKASLPTLSGPRPALTSIIGTPPDLQRLPTACAFAPRCQQAMRVCQRLSPPLVTDDGQYNRCWLPYRDQSLNEREAGRD